jgi:hypothetical protein
MKAIYKTSPANASPYFLPTRPAKKKVKCLIINHFLLQVNRTGSGKQWHFSTLLHKTLAFLSCSDYVSLLLFLP